MIQVHFNQTSVLVSSHTQKCRVAPNTKKTSCFISKAYWTGSGRDAHPTCNDAPIDVDLLLIGEHRALTGIGRQRTS